jgi:hypothetical protein
MCRSLWSAGRLSGTGGERSQVVCRFDHTDDSFGAPGGTPRHWAERRLTVNLDAVGAFQGINCPCF